MLEQLRRFFSNEAGQSRREGIAALDTRANEALDYYLGPTGIPDRLRALNQMFNPVVHAQESGAAFQRAADPERSRQERLASLVEGAAGTGLAAFPAYAAYRGAMRSGQGILATWGLPSGASGPRAADEITEDLLAYNQRARTPAGMLDRNVVPPNANSLLLRPDRNYRYIGDEGYDDFLRSGVIRGRQGTKQDYGDAYFMHGRPSGRYAGGGGDRYIVETPHGAGWQNDPAGAYTRPPRNLSGDDPIRIFELGPDGTYRVVFDNIGDRAFLP